MGDGAYGVAAAAESYFGKQLKDLTLSECATIAGLPRNPTLYSPRLHPANAKKRRNYVLDRMVAEQMVSPRLAAEAKAQPIAVIPRRRETELAPYFVEWVRQSLSDRYSTDEIWRKGLRVYTTLNIEMQQAAAKALRDGLRAYDKKHGWRGSPANVLKDRSATLETYVHPDWHKAIAPGDLVTGLVRATTPREATVKIGKYEATISGKEVAWTKAKSPSAILQPGDLAMFEIVELDETNNTARVKLDQVPVVQGALVTVENATGEVKAMVGGYDFEKSEFNRATQAMRQVGSTFKPIVFSTALEKGMSADSSIIDAPISFTDALGRTWRPGNYDGTFKGEISLRQTLAESRNVPTIKLASLVGIKNVLIMARRFGLSGPMEPYLPLALGACEATPLEMAAALSVFPNLGVQAVPYATRRIEDYDRVKKEESTPRMRKVLDPEIAGRMLSLLENVVHSGTAAAAKSLGRPVGGKTGTTNDFADAWFVGFTPSLTTAVWVGYDAKTTLGNKEAGSVVALPIWIDFMAAILKDKPIEQFRRPRRTPELLTEQAEPDLLGRKKLFIEDLPATPNPAPAPIIKP
jgi:penicillin-binding protein 1A